MIKHAQLETVKTWLNHPDYAKYPLYLRIQRALRQLIVDGSLAANKALPATRALAKSLSVSRDTVENAYSLLHAEGYIERRMGSGSFVAPVPALNKPQKSRSLTNQTPNPSKLSQRGQLMIADRGLREVLVPKPFAPGVPETRLFPLSLWARLERQVIKEHSFQALQRCDSQGILALRQVIADYVNLERGAHASAERVLILTSSQQAISLCAQLLLDAGDKIIMENPMYQGARSAFNSAGVTICPISVDQQGIQAELFANQGKGAKAVFLTPSHQYPTGVTLSLERRLALIEWAQQQQAWIIEDDYDSEFHYASKPTACVQGLDSYQRTIYIGTFTKSLFPGLRIGYMILPPSLVLPMTTARILQDGHNATISQLTLARFIENGHFGAYIRQMRLVYAKRLAYLQQCLASELSEYLIPSNPLGGMQIFCELRLPIDEDQVIALAKQQRIELTKLSSLYLNHDQKSGFLLGFAAYTTNEIYLAVQALKTIFADIVHSAEI